MNNVISFFKVAFCRDSITNALNVSLVVGTILNLINQWEPIIQFNTEEINYFKSTLTYCVPFSVSIYVAGKTLLKFRPGDRSKVQAQLECANCKKGSQYIKKDEFIAECTHCGPDTNWKIV